VTVFSYVLKVKDLILLLLFVWVVSHRLDIRLPWIAARIFKCNFRDLLACLILGHLWTYIELILGHVGRCRVIQLVGTFADIKGRIEPLFGLGVSTCHVGNMTHRPSVHLLCVVQVDYILTSPRQHQTRVEVLYSRPKTLVWKPHHVVVCRVRWLWGRCDVEAWWD